MIRILGIDPGSQLTGYGVVEFRGEQAIWVTSGCLRIKGDDLASRLRMIFTGVNEIVDDTQPDEVAIESIFMHRNAASALKLGQARGAAVSAVAIRLLPVHEYTPAEIKKAIVGKGNAAKGQIQHMVKTLLGLNKVPQEDAADALAVALCHAHTRRTLNRMAGMNASLERLS